MNQNICEDSILVQSPGKAGYQMIQSIVENNADAKIIAVDRDPIALCYANYKRNIEKFGITSVHNKFLPRYISKYRVAQIGFINKIQRYQNDIKKLSNKNNNVFIVKTEDFICNTKITMDKVADFLGIESNKILYKPTILGEDLGGSMNLLIGKIYDDPYCVLEATQINFLKMKLGLQVKVGLQEKIKLNVIDILFRCIRKMRG